MNNLLVKKVIKHAYHRNGVCGNGFLVILFIDKENGDKKLGIVFPHERGNCAILSMDLLAEDVIEFGKNSWRGDHYEQELLDAIGWKDEE